MKAIRGDTVAQLVRALSLSGLLSNADGGQLLDGFTHCHTASGNLTHELTLRAVSPTLSDESINRGLVCAARIQHARTIKILTVMCNRRMIAGYSYTRTMHACTPEDGMWRP